MQHDPTPVRQTDHRTAYSGHNAALKYYMCDNYRRCIGNPHRGHPPRRPHAPLGSVAYGLTITCGTSLAPGINDPTNTRSAPCTRKTPACPPP
ncbi:hypothetical protein [Komagataeibacter xylinus]|uniref:hypothetical protein n=1 Tax=Komagataeibacter xylinus TaxID=28448 RepID=UPI0010309BBB|nr:hypothetical protein [Komagataeibacter xylinus]